MNEKQKRRYLLETENVKTALLRLGIPTMIGMLVSALYNIVDTFFVGKLGTSQTAAVSIVYPVTMIGLGIGLLFGSGAGSYISRLLGRKEYDKASACSSTAIFSGILTILVVISGMLLFLEPMMRLFGATDASIPYALDYGKFYILGLVFNVFNIMVNNMLVAEGASSFSMAAMLIGGGANLVLDPILIFGCGMGVQGAAVATLISQTISAVFYLVYLTKGKSYLKLSLRYFKPSRPLFGEISKIGLPVCIFQFLTGGANQYCCQPIRRICNRCYGNRKPTDVSGIQRPLWLSKRLFPPCRLQLRLRQPCARQGRHQYSVALEHSFKYRFWYCVYSFLISVDSFIQSGIRTGFADRTACSDR